MTRIKTILLCMLLATSISTLADDKTDVAQATQAWIDAMTAHDPDRVLALYSADAVLWGTRSPTIRTNREKVSEYFGILKTVPASYKATLGEQHIRVYGDMAINSGSYTFSQVEDGKEAPRPARFSMVFRKIGGQWLIVDHHSSAVPAAPK